MSTFGEKAKAFNRSLGLNVRLPPGVSAMNPFAENGPALRISDQFYDKFYNDQDRRHLILGINPGRFGAALSGVPFTDFKRLEQFCGISADGRHAHEPSSEFVYAMITSMGTVNAFYKRFYINSVCPLGFVISKEGRRPVNYNYYDDNSLFEAVKPFIVSSIRHQIALGCHTDACVCLGIKNSKFLKALNSEYGFFRKISVLPHPRFIVQYRRKAMAEAIAGYEAVLSSVSA